VHCYLPYRAYAVLVRVQWPPRPIVAVASHASWIYISIVRFSLASKAALFLTFISFSQFFVLESEPGALPTPKHIHDSHLYYHSQLPHTSFIHGSPRIFSTRHSSRFSRTFGTRRSSAYPTR
jgi:hypothetical protein